MPTSGDAVAALGAAVLVAGAGMIDRAEILGLASELGLQPRVVEKDYILGWVLAGIARDQELSRAWLFKGGTCLKKCFFETYRFSEDLDFTVMEPAQLDRDFLISRFKPLATWLYDATGAIRIPGRSTPFIEVIRFAASNHLLVDLDYRDEQGNQRTRPIEPYSMRRTKDGNIILCAVNAEKQESRSYRVERIRGATILNRSFAPRFLIELTPSGPLAVPDTPRASENPWRQAPPARRSTTNAWSKTTYLYRCPICSKRFERSTMNGTLRAHKAPAGYPCSGRHGIYEGTK
jgi:hypothetical protein